MTTHRNPALVVHPGRSGYFSFPQGAPLIALPFQEIVMRKWSRIITLVTLLATPALAQSTVPDLRGTWKGDSESIIAGTGNKHHAAAAAQDTPELRSMSFTLVIDKQDGRRVSGVFSSARTSQALIGVLSRTGTLLMVDKDGYTFGTLLAPDRLELCYLQTTSDGRVASCTELKKQP
jgi:hypothetical protein